MMTAIAGIIMSMIMGITIPHGITDTHEIVNLSTRTKIVITDPLIGESTIENYEYNYLTEEWEKVES